MNRTRNQVVVSLGGGCDVALILRHFYLRQASLPFDWLWNLHDGLRAVTSIIANDFLEVRSRDAYIRSPHFRWPNQEVVVFRNYPNIAHVHGNPLEDSHAKETLNRRIDRLTRILTDPQREIVFVYYRRFDEGPELLCESTVADRTQKLIDESLEFMEMMDRKYAHPKMRLISVFSTDEPFLSMPSVVHQFAKNARRCAMPTIDFEWLIARPENNRRAGRHWKNQWRNLLLRQGVMSRVDLVKTIPLSTGRRIQQMLPRKFRNIASQI
ncbi:hypothetical protein EC9_10280 [Rosistilla ulvae]|uniref:Papain-like cysteine peptidase (DUF1796) n=1 Tax=Rosistilla ulvae TaxID=1930277 RepID=A0A517LW57_9BACT|nr:DUF1796 family putative cysteine peptidase [Rosistilla ulvae]QDS86853.1 hypothetical protein EC9_10280 [Rosistilla ulvae]